MGSILGIGRGIKARKLANQGVREAQANPLLQTAQGLGDEALGSIGGFLGLGGEQAQTDAFNRFQDSTGFNYARDEGLNAITGNAAVRGSMNSGSTLRALQDRGTQLANQSYGQYLGLLGDVANRGQQASNTQVAAATSGGVSAAQAQPQNTGILGRFFGI